MRLSKGVFCFLLVSFSVSSAFAKMMVFIPGKSIFVENAKVTYNRSEDNVPDRVSPLIPIIQNEVKTADMNLSLALLSYKQSPGAITFSGYLEVKALFEKVNLKVGQFVENNPDFKDYQVNVSFKNAQRYLSDIQFVYAIPQAIVTSSEFIAQRIAGDLTRLECNDIPRLESIEVNDYSEDKFLSITIGVNFDVDMNSCIFPL